MKNIFLAWAKENNWNVKERTSESNLPQEVTERYPNIPAEWYDFINAFSDCSDSSDTVWFLTAENYFAKDEDEWSYNEFEHISLQAADGDADWTRNVCEFWNTHFPILLSVKYGYEYYAINMEDGSIVCGSEPEFEETDKVADNFVQFIEKIVAGEIEL